MLYGSRAERVGQTSSRFGNGKDDLLEQTTVGSGGEEIHGICYSLDHHVVPVRHPACITKLLANFSSLTFTMVAKGLTSQAGA